MPYKSINAKLIKIITMHWLFSNFLFSRLLASTMIANYCTLVLLNAINSPVYLTPIVYILTFILSCILLFQLKFRLVKFTIDYLSITMILIALGLLVIPRITYLLDWLPGHTVLSISDDYARVLEILALVSNIKYPLLSPSNQEYLFSFYYSSFYLCAVLKIMFPILSIKESIAIFNIIYYFFILFSIYEISFLTLRDLQKVRMMVFLCTIFGGLDWIISGNILTPYGHFEWWQKSFHGNTQISSFYTGYFWAVHHFLAGYAAILSFAFLFFTRSPNREYVKHLLVAMLLVSSFYMSPFAFMPILIYIFIHYEIICRRILTPYNCILLFTTIFPSYIFLNKISSTHFFHWSTFHIKFANNFLIDKIFSLPFYFIVVTGIEYMGIPLILVLIWKKLLSRERQYLIGSLIFFMTTYIIAYSGFNNYSMRGMIIPTFVFYWIFSNHWKYILSFLNSFGKSMRCVIVSVLILLSIMGTFKEFGGRLVASLKNYSFTYCCFKYPVPGQLRIPLYEMSKKNTFNTIDFRTSLIIGRFHIYEFEKMIQGLNLDEMKHWEVELIRKPFG